jgi:RNA polymerase sigma factor (sigma-70 family)
LDFDATFDEHYADLVRYCQRLTGDRDVAEDVAQESMFRLFGNELRGGPEGVRAWLFTTAIHLVRDRHRVDRNRRRLLELHPPTPGTQEPPDRLLERAEERAMAQAALDTLSTRDREVLLMRYSGFSYREIADAVGLASTSVGTTLARAEQRFAEAVSKAGEAA